MYTHQLLSGIYYVFVSIGDWFMGILNLIPKLTYFFCVTLMSVMDALQYVMRKLAGLDTYYIDGEAQSGDIALSFIRSVFVDDSKFPALKNAFWALVIFGVILLVISTIVAIIRQEYMPSGEDMKEKPTNNKMYVIGRSIKSLFLFLVVPVSCFFGLMFSDVILYVLDNVTTSSNIGGTLLSSENMTTTTNAQGETIKTELLESSQTSAGYTTYVHFDFFGAHRATTTATFSGFMFKSAAYSSNRVRINNDYECNDRVATYSEYLQDDVIMNFGLFTGNDDEVAQKIDDAFACCVKLKTPVAMRITDGPLDGEVNGNLAFTIWDGEEVQTFSKFNIGLVFYYYNLWYFNFLIGFAFLVVGLKLFFNIILGLMKRIVELTALFIISPPIIALMPLDGGKAFGDWRKNFLAKALGIYGAIIGINLFFLILPLLNEIQFFDPNIKGFSFLNILMSSLFIIVGLSTVESFIGLLSGMIGGDDAAKAGSELSGKVGDTLAKSAKLTGAAAGVATKAVSLPARLAGKGARGVINKIGRKKTGDKNWDINKKLKTGIKNTLTKRFTTKGGRNKIRKEFGKDWNNGGAEKAYDEYVNNDENFQNNMDAAFKNRKDKNLTREQWENSAEGVRKRKESITAAGLSDLAGFKSGITVDANGSITSEVAGSAAAKMFKEKREQNVLDTIQKRRDLYWKGDEKHDGKLKGIGKAAKILGVNNIASISSIFFDEVKSGLVSGGKGGFASMMRAFRGLSAKQIEQEELLKKFQKDEAAKVRAQQKAKAKYDKSDK